MTGFARASSRQEKGAWVVEIRSLNHRYFEFSLKVPPSIYGLEDRIREFCQNRLRRGKITVSIVETNQNPLEELNLDEKVLGFYIRAIQRVQRRFQLNGALSISDILALPRIFSVEKKPEGPEKLWPRLKPALEMAVARLIQAKKREGQVLSKDLVQRLGKIGTSLHKIERRAEKTTSEIYERIRKRIDELFGKLAQDERIWQEAVLLAERADITEEIVRFKSHMALFKDKISKEEEVGKELDFIVQELNREVNTISSKGQDVGISAEVVLIKAELEKIREQIQNIE